MKASDIKVTTTPGFDGVEIVEYLEPITAHVVVGMNFFKDIFTGLTDFFGGNSRMYQNTLASINNEVINKLRSKALIKGGNCIVGLKIDNDQISAQGKSMIMVTALGTAAKADFSKKSIDAANAEFSKNKADMLSELASQRISNDYFSLLKQKKQYLEESENGSLKMNDSFWEFVTKNSVDELADYVLEEYINSVENNWITETSENFKILKNNVIEYFSVIDAGTATECLYNKIKEELSLKVRNKIIELIEETNLIDYSLIKVLISSPEFSVQKVGVQLSPLAKLSYTNSDIELIDNLISLISQTLTPRGDKIIKKTALSSTDKEIWICECNTENNTDREHCTKCGNDIYGFDSREVKPAEVVGQLIEKVEILKSAIGQS